VAGANIDRPELDEHGELNVREAIGAEKIGATVYELTPGKRLSPYHWHVAEEEWLLVVRGAPTLRTPEGERVLREGDVFVFPTGERGAHTLTNATEEPVRVLMISNLAEIEICVYPDSKKVGAWAPGVQLMNRVENNLDYWDGEEL
jgi:uncharacterized cupin superfamily protein